MGVCWKAQDRAAGKPGKIGKPRVPLNNLGEDGSWCRSFVFDSYQNNRFPRDCLVIEQS